MNENLYESVIKQSPVGYAYHKLICDHQGVPDDYMFLDVNPAFGKLTGLHAEEVVGKRVTEVLPGIRDGGFDWVAFYGEMTHKGEKRDFTQFSEPLNRWYKVSAYSPKAEHFVTLFTDVTEHQQQLADMNKLVESSDRFLQNIDNNFDFQAITDEFRNLCQAKYVAFNVFEPDGRNFSTVAVSGDNGQIRKAEKRLGFTLPGKKWAYDPRRMALIANKIITRFSSLHELTENTIPLGIISAIEKMFRIGEVVIVRIQKNSTMLGDFTVMMPKGKLFTNDKIAEVFTRQLGLSMTRKQVVDLLAVERMRALNILEATNAGAWEWNIQTGELIINHRRAEIVGYTIEELSPVTIDSVRKYIHPADLQKFEDHLDQVFKKKLAVYDVEYRIKHKQGHWVWVQDRGKVTAWDADGNPELMYGTLVDISVQVQAQEKMQLQAAALKTTATSILITDKDRKIIWCNPAFSQLTGYAPDEAIGKACKTLIGTSKHPKAFYKEMDDTLASGNSWKGTILNRRKDGTIYYDASTFTPIINEAGETTHYIEMKEDITERVHREEALRKTTENLQAIHDHSPLMISEFDADGRYLNANRAVAEFFNASDPVDVISRTFGELLPGNAENGYLKHIPQILKQKQPLTVENHLQAPQGEIYLLSTLFPLFDIKGQVRSIGVIAQDISELKQAEAMQRRRLVELESLEKITDILRHAQTVDKALPKILHQTLDALEIPAGEILLFESNSQTFRATASAGWYRNTGHLPLKINQGISGKVLSSGRSHITEEFAQDPIFHSASGEVAPPGWGGACVPIQAFENTLGLIFIACEAPRQIQPDEVQLLEAIARIVGISLHRMSLHEETVRRVERLEAQRTIEKAVAGLFDLPMTLEIIVNQALMILPADAVSLFLYEPHTLTLNYAAGSGFTTEGFQNTSYRVGEGYGGRAALDYKPVHLDDLKNITPSFKRMPLAQEEHFVCYSAVPLVAKGQLKGILEVFHRTPFHHDDEWASYLESLALQAAVAIDDLQIYKEMQHSNLILSQAFDQMIERWSAVIDQRENESEGHTLDVTEMALTLAKALGVREEDLVHLKRGGLLHDVGKLSVPESILSKDNNLTEQERDVVKDHPMYAYKMLSSISYLRPALDIPYCHHENWDGSGYPRQLKGEQIPLAARIFSVVNTWDDLLSPRHSQGAVSEEKALNSIRARAGKDFDPRVVDAFIKLIEEKILI
jgi:PAS domain S-box-containing protein